jgi:hypothetical protein
MTERAPGSGVALGSVIPDNENAPVGLPGWTDVSQRISREWDRAVSFFGRLLRRRLVAIAAEYRLLGVRAFRLVENATDKGPFNRTPVTQWPQGKNNLAFTETKELRPS